MLEMPGSPESHKLPNAVAVVELTIVADPNAAERAGAVRIGEAPADALPGRLLPLYEVRLDSTGDRDLEPHLGGRSKRYEALCSSGKFRRASGSLRR